SPSVSFNFAAARALYALSLHDALPICPGRHRQAGSERSAGPAHAAGVRPSAGAVRSAPERATDEPDRAAPDQPGASERGLAGERSEEHTSELQSRSDLVCRLLLEKKKP